MSVVSKDKPAKRTSLNVSPIPNHAMWYTVESQSKEDPNQVHLDEYEGNAGCCCEDFCFTCLPNMKKNPGKFIDYGEKGNPNPNRTRCVHIKVAIKYWADHVLRAVSMELRGK